MWPSTPRRQAFIADDAAAILTVLGLVPLGKWGLLALAIGVTSFCRGFNRVNPRLATNGSQKVIWLELYVEP